MGYVGFLLAKMRLKLILFNAQLPNEIVVNYKLRTTFVITLTQ